MRPFSMLKGVIQEGDAPCLALADVPPSSCRCGLLLLLYLRCGEVKFRGEDADDNGGGRYS